MATESTKTRTTTEVPDLATKIREQVLSGIQQGQQLSIAAARTWVKAVSTIPFPELPEIPGLASVPGVEAATSFTFDVAADLLKSQRDFALQLADVLAPLAPA